MVEKRYQVIFGDDGLISEVPITPSFSENPETAIIFGDDGMVREVPAT
jgi:hypothetical protein